MHATGTFPSCRITWKRSWKSWLNNTRKSSAAGSSITRFEIKTSPWEFDHFKVCLLTSSTRNYHELVEWLERFVLESFPCLNLYLQLVWIYLFCIRLFLCWLVCDSSTSYWARQTGVKVPSSVPKSKNALKRFNFKKTSVKKVNNCSVLGGKVDSRVEPKQSRWWKGICPNCDRANIIWFHLGTFQIRGRSGNANNKYNKTNDLNTKNIKIFNFTKPKNYKDRWIDQWS